MEEHESAKSFKDLLVWQKAHQFVLEVYRLTEKFSSKETYGLTSQFRRASISIPANIAEGFRKRGKADKVRYLNIAEGSLQECIYYLILAKYRGMPRTLNFSISLMRLEKCSMSIHTAFYLLNSIFRKDHTNAQSHNSSSTRFKIILERQF